MQTSQLELDFVPFLPCVPVSTICLRGSLGSQLCACVAAAARAGYMSTACSACVEDTQRAFEAQVSATNGLPLL
jgi:hypothetical protein